MPARLEARRVRDSRGEDFEGSPEQEPAQRLHARQLPDVEVAQFDGLVPVGARIALHLGGLLEGGDVLDAAAIRVGVGEPWSRADDEKAQSSVGFSKLVAPRGRKS